MKCMSQFIRIMSLKMRWVRIWATFGIQTKQLIPLSCILGHDPTLLTGSPTETALWKPSLCGVLVFFGVNSPFSFSLSTTDILPQCSILCIAVPPIKSAMLKLLLAGCSPDLQAETTTIPPPNSSLLVGSWYFRIFNVVLDWSSKATSAHQQGILYKNLEWFLQCTAGNTTLQERWNFFHTGEMNEKPWMK